MGVYDDLFSLPPPEAETKMAAADPHQTGGVYDDLFKTTPDGGKTIPSIRRPGREPDPETDAWSGKLGRFALGAAEPVVGTAQTISHLMPIGGGTMDSVATAFAQKQAHARKAAGIEEGGWDIPGILGNVAATAAPLAKAVGWASKAPSYLGMAGRGAVAGAAGAASDPIKDTSEGYWGQKGENLALGAALGAGTGVLGETAARVALPVIDEKARWLADRGVRTTIGQTIGGWAKRAEDVAQSLPFVGDTIRAKREQAMHDAWRGMGEETAQLVGEHIPKDMPTEDILKHLGGMGADANAAAGQTPGGILGQKFDEAYQNAALLPKGPSGVGTKNFSRYKSELKAGARRALTASEFESFEKKINTHVDSVIAKAAHPTRGGAGAPIAGKDLQQMITDLKGLETESYNASSNTERNLAPWFTKYREAIEDATNINSPGFKGKLSAASDAWSNFTRMQKAAGTSAAIGHENIPTMTGFASAVAHLDPSTRNRLTSTGRSPLQDWPEHGKAVLPAKVSDSGTPERGFWAGLGAAAMTGAIPHYAIPAMAATGIGVPTLYSEPMQNLARRYLLSRTAPQQWAARNIRAATPWGALAAGRGTANGGETPNYADGGTVSAGLSELTSQLKQQGVRL